MRPLRLRREAASEASGAVDKVPLSRYVLTLRKTLKTCVAIGGSTTGALLRGQEKLRESKTMAHTRAAALAIDEVAMMLTPHVVALATLLADEGRILLAGDHRQLGVILTHDWDAEDRPNIVAYQPQASAYATVHALTEHSAVTPAMARRIGLSVSRRLPAAILRLVAPVYAQDGITLRGPQRPVVPPGPRPAGAAGQVVWGEEAGICPYPLWPLTGCPSTPPLAAGRGTFLRPSLRLGGVPDHGKLAVAPAESLAEVVSVIWTARRSPYYHGAKHGGTCSRGCRPAGRGG